MKNNVTKELFMKWKFLVLVEDKIPKSVKWFKDIQPENLLDKFIHFGKHDMNCNYLGKKREWRVKQNFNENKETKKV